MTPTHVVTWPSGRLIIIATDAWQTEDAWLPALLGAVEKPHERAEVTRLTSDADDEIARRRRLRSVLTDFDDRTHVVAFNAACTSVIDHLAAAAGPWRLGGLLFCFDSAFDVGGIPTRGVSPRGPVLTDLRLGVRRRIVASAKGRNDVPPNAAAEFARLIAAEYHALGTGLDDGGRTRAGGAAALAPLVRRLTAPPSPSEGEAWRVPDAPRIEQPTAWSPHRGHRRPSRAPHE